MNILEEIKNRIKKYPELELIHEEDTITIKALSLNGFDVWFYNGKDEYIVGFDGWHEHFKKNDTKSALDCFIFGLSNQCRLKVTSRGGKTYKWTIESLENGEWITYSTTGSLWIKFWNTPVVKYLSNGIIKI